MAETAPDTNSTSRRHEEPDVQLRLIVMFGVGLAIVTAAVLLVAVWLFNDFAASRAQVQGSPAPLAETRPLPPEPRLQIAPAQELLQIRAAEDAVLSSYGWVNQAAGLVRIPIDRAIERVIEQGLPVWRENSAPQQTEDGAAPVQPGGR